MWWDRERPVIAFSWFYFFIFIFYVDSVWSSENTEYFLIIFIQLNSTLSPSLSPLSLSLSLPVCLSLSQEWRRFLRKQTTVSVSLLLHMTSPSDLGFRVETVVPLGTRYSDLAWYNNMSVISVGVKVNKSLKDDLRATEGSPQLTQLEVHQICLDWDKS